MKKEVEDRLNRVLETGTAFYTDVDWADVGPAEFGHRRGAMTELSIIAHVIGREDLRNELDEVLWPRR